MNKPHTDSCSCSARTFFFFSSTEILGRSTGNLTTATEAAQSSSRYRFWNLVGVFSVRWACTDCASWMMCCYRLNLPATSFGVNTQSNYTLIILAGFQQKLYKFPLLVIMLSFILHLYFPSLITKWSKERKHSISSWFIFFCLILSHHFR